jgi:hypothetical protein
MLENILKNYLFLHMFFLGDEHHIVGSSTINMVVSDANIKEDLNFCC